MTAHEIEEALVKLGRSRLEIKPDSGVIRICMWGMSNVGQPTWHAMGDTLAETLKVAQRVSQKKEARAHVG